MIYEMRTYSLIAGAAAEFARHAAEVATPIRGDRYGRLEGFWTTEIGRLHQVMHLWSFESFDERHRLRTELFQDSAWVNEYVPLVRPYLVRQDVRLMHEIKPIVRPDTTGNIYEFRHYRLKPGCVGQWAHLFMKYLPAREEYSQVTGVFHTESEQPNEVCHLWVYTDMNARLEARNAAAADPQWQEFLGQGLGLMDEMHSTILVPASHSPLR